MIEKAKKIKMVLTDVDGVLTDASMNFFTDAEGEMREVKKFNAFDGIAVHMLRDFGIKSGIITGGNALATEKRAKTLGMDYLYYSCLDKLPALEDAAKKSGLSFDEIAFIGDDLIDIPVLKRVGFACVVKSGRKEAKDAAHIVLEASAGQGAFREVAEIVLKARGFWPDTLKNAEAGTIGKSKKPQSVIISYKDLTI